METDILDNMATYAQQVLMLFLPWRHQNVLDMSPIDSIACLQHFYEIGKITPFHLQLLQNVQDCYDSLSSDIPPDPLESCTRDLIEDSTFLDEDKNELIEQLLSEDMSEVAAILSETMFSDQQDGAFQNDHIHSISLDKIRSQGGHNCGFHLVQPPALSIFHQQFISIQAANESSATLHETTFPSSHAYDDEIISQRRLFQVVFRSSSRNVGTVPHSLHQIEANGSKDSINTWADLAFSNPETGIIDEDQKRAFQVIIASFLSTYLDEADKNDIKTWSYITTFLSY